MSSGSNICSIIMRYCSSLRPLPRSARHICDCSYLLGIYRKLVKILSSSKGHSMTLSQLKDHFDNLRALEFVIYSLSRSNILKVRYTGGFTRKTRPGSRKAWSGLSMTMSRKDMAERMLFYLFTTANRSLRRRRIEAFYNAIEVILL